MVYRTKRVRHDIDLSGLTELVVHGVGGASPEQVLDVPYTEWVAGDLTAGFFAAPHPPTAGPSRRREVYSWGGLTSRSALRALWLLLIPYALVNLAGWMGERRAAPAVSAVERVGVLTLRLAGLALTATATFFVAVAAIDLWAYQCGSRPCAESGKIIAWPLSTDFAQSGLGNRLVIGALVPIAAISLVAWLTRRSQSFAHRRNPVIRPGDLHDPALRIGLQDDRFWDSPHVAHRLGLAHTAVATATTGHVLSQTLVGIGLDIELYPPTFIALLAGCAVLVGWLGVLGDRWYWGVFLLAGGALAGLLVIALGAGGIADQGRAPLARTLAGPLFWVTVLLIMLFAVMRLWVTLGEPGGITSRRLFNAFAPAALVVIGVMGYTAVGSGGLVQLARLLGNATTASQFATLDASGREASIVYSDVNGAIAVNTVIVLGVLLMVTIGFLFLAWRRREPIDQIAGEYARQGSATDPSDPLVRSLVGRIQRARAVAKMTDYVAAIIGLAVLALVLSVVIAVVRAGGNVATAQSVFPRWQQPASLVLSFLPIVALFLLNRSVRSAGLRRGLGILWDVATFWPRWFHPFAPPSYGERAVPQLAHRVAAIHDAAGRVVLSAHSQGSVVAVAALLVPTMSPAQRGSCALLTHGSPLGRLYTRFFDRYFDETTLRHLATSLSEGGRIGWINLYRPTDFIGGPIFEANPPPGFVGIRQLDPETLTIVLGEPLPQPMVHFGYSSTDLYDAALARLVAEWSPS